jgi:sulfur carrier protein
MIIRLNGEMRDVPEGVTVAQLLSSIGVPPARVAVEVNLEIVPRERYPHVRFADGDVVEIVSFVGGG